MATRRSSGLVLAFSASDCSAGEIAASCQVEASLIAACCRLGFFSAASPTTSFSNAASSPAGLTLRVTAASVIHCIAFNRRSGAKPSGWTTLSKTTFKSCGLPRLQIISTTVPCRSAGRRPL